ncbi:MAG: NAD(+) synthase [Thermotogota bacterium]
MNLQEQKKKIESFIHDFYKKYNYKGALIGISGGIDSAVIAKLLVNSLGKDNVFGLLLPERDSSPNTVDDSLLVCKELGIKYNKKDITGILRKTGAYKLEPSTFLIPRTVQNKYVKKRWKESSEDTFITDLKGEGDEDFRKGLAFYRIKHRIRMVEMYFEAEKRNYFVSGTTNKSEYKTGFFVKYGDDAADIEPLFHLYKTEVIALAKLLKVPEKIINKAPSPDLLPGVTDEFAMGISYDDLDNILKDLENEKSLEKYDQSKIERVKNILKYSYKKRLKALHL